MVFVKGTIAETCLLGIFNSIKAKIHLQIVGLDLTRVLPMFRKTVLQTLFSSNS